MNRIESKVKAARRRLLLGKFGRALSVSLFVALLVSIIAIAIPAVWFVDVDYKQWAFSWIVGSVVVAMVVAAGYAWITAPSRESVATEVDRRFSLRERLSSAMTLKEQDRETPFGLALVDDADRRADQLAIADQFALRPSRMGWLPITLLPVLAIVWLLVEPAHRSDASSTSQVDAAEIKQVQTAAAQLKKRIAQQRRNAEAKDLKEAEKLFEKIEADLNEIAKRKDLSRKDAMIAMNDLKKELEERRKQLGSGEQMRRAMAQMKGLQAGPAEEVVKSMERGEFGKAQDAIKKLAEKVRSGEMTEQEKKELAEQVEKIKERMQQAVKRHEQKKQELQQQIDKAKREGRGQDAAKLQQQLNQLKQQDGQMQQMQQMAQSMSQAAQSMQQGDASQAADALQEMAEQLGGMQEEMSQLEDLQAAMDDLSQSKNQMRCKGCDGAGCSQCQGKGFGMGMGFGRGMGDGLGQGQGAGDRPEAAENTNTYETQVRGDVRRGRAVIAGFADGPNRKGVTQEELKQAIQSSLSEESDPLENQTLPRPEREHARQYFDRLREGSPSP